MSTVNSGVDYHVVSAGQHKMLVWIKEQSCFKHYLSLQGELQRQCLSLPPTPHQLGAGWAPGMCQRLNRVICKWLLGCCTGTVWQSCFSVMSPWGSRERPIKLYFDPKCLGGKEYVGPVDLKLCKTRVFIAFVPPPPFQDFISKPTWSLSQPNFWHPIRKSGQSCCNLWHGEGISSK